MTNPGENTEQIVDKDAIHPLTPPERQRRMRQARQQLLTNHECAHLGRWKRRKGYQPKEYRCKISSTQHKSTLWHAVTVTWLHVKNVEDIESELMFEIGLWMCIRLPK